MLRLMRASLVCIVFSPFLLIQFEPVVGMSALLEFLRFIYTGRSGIMDPLTALDVLFLTKGAHGSGGKHIAVWSRHVRRECTCRVPVQGVALQIVFCVAPLRSYTHVRALRQTAGIVRYCC